MRIGAKPKKAPKVYRPPLGPGKAHTERVKAVAKEKMAGEPMYYKTPKKRRAIGIGAGAKVSFKTKSRKKK